MYTGFRVGRQCFPDFSNEVGEIRLGDERCRPETFLQLGLGEDLWTIEHERREQVERLGCEVNLATSAHQLPGVEVRVNGPKRMRTTALLSGNLRSPCEFPGTLGSSAR